MKRVTPQLHSAALGCCQVAAFVFAVGFNHILIVTRDGCHKLSCQFGCMFCPLDGLHMQSVLRRGVREGFFMHPEVADIRNAAPRASEPATGGATLCAIAAL
eukprot:3271228-Amphidinium_carterae.3